MDYSIVIPVFNKAGLTRNCLATLRPTLEGAGEGEIIVVDNASTDETPEMLAEFPWATVVRNERNLGFAGANNQAAAMARGRILVLLNNDTQGLPGWLAAMIRALDRPNVGIVGARLLYPDNTIQHAGVIIAGVLFGRAGLSPYHHAWRHPGNESDVNVAREYQVVTGACLATPRELYARLGGLDEIYWNGYEDVDYCLKVRELGMKVVYEPAAALYHFESQSGVQRFRKVFWNIRVLGDRWDGKVRFDASARNVETGHVSTLVRDPDTPMSIQPIVTPPTTVLVHGTLVEGERAAFETKLRANRSPIANAIWSEEDAALTAARAAMAVRGERFLAFVDARARLEPGWLDELVAQIAYPPNVAAATFAPEVTLGENVRILASDARCTLLSLKQFPQHLELREFDTLSGAVADLLLRAIECERGTRGVSRALGTLPAIEPDASFERVRGRTLESTLDDRLESYEEAFRARPRPARGLVSIVTLSWNAPTFTKKALESIRAHTSEPYEVIVVDNGSGPETLAMLAEIDDPHVRVIYNATNRGFGGGNNDGMAAANGEHIVVLNNDVVVTHGWLDGLIEPLLRNPAIGVTAPRSNKVVGHQQLHDSRYQTEEEMTVYAARRREAFEQRGYFADRAIGLCLCMPRTLLDQIGGFDERFEMGNFEDDDFSMRVRAAGYGIFICDSVFIHHYGSQSFAANKVDYMQTMHANWAKFAEKWGYPPAYPTNGYHPKLGYSRGFVRERHHFPIPQSRPAEPERDAALPAGVRLILTVPVGNEEEWSSVAEFVKRFARAFKIDDGVMLAIGVLGDPGAQTFGERVERIFKRAGVDPQTAGYVEISDEDDERQWLSRFEAIETIDVRSIDDRSPSALRRLASAGRA